MVWTIQLYGQDYAKEAAALQKAIRQYYYVPTTNYYTEHYPVKADDRKVSYLWPLCALMQAGVELQKTDQSNKLLDTVFSVIQKYLRGTDYSNGIMSYAEPLGGGSRFYDDNQWIGIAALDAYTLTHDAKWLNLGKDIYTFMMKGYDTLTGGGLYWEEEKFATKNTCSNGPGILLACKLYQVTQEKKYLQTAVQLYEWVNKWLRSPENLYYDLIRVKDHTIDRRLYSYNTGTMLQANVYLYEITKNKKYMQDANAIAAAGTEYFLKNNTIRDNYWFMAVLLRGYAHLYKWSKDRRYLTIFEQATQNELKKKDQNGLIGDQKEKNLVPLGGMLEILARLSLLSE